MRPGLGVVPELGVVDRDLAQKPAARKLVEGIVDRAQRRGEPDRPRLVIDHFRREVAIPGAEDRAREIEPLPGRPHPGGRELPQKDAGAGFAMRSALGFHGLRMPPAGGQSRRRRAIVNLIEASSLIRLGCLRNLNLGPEGSQAQVGAGRPTRWRALPVSHMVHLGGIVGAFSWRLRAGVCAGRFGSKSTPTRRSAPDIAGAASANISAAGPERSAPPSARRASRCPDR